MADDRKTVPVSADPTVVGSAAPARTTIPLRVGSVILDRLLGAGGMGEVWLGRHELLGREVAVKFLTNAVAGPGDPGFDMFIEGARAAAAVKHPGLTDIHDAGVTDVPATPTSPAHRIPYLIMELVKGPGLDSVLRACGPLSIGASLAVMEGVCTAIGELHAAGFIHRDIKPANVLLDGDGGIHVTDFGLACERSNVGSARVAVSGTPAYMAPETFQGEVSARADVYALAMMLHELLTGAPPFTGDVLTLRTAHQTEPLSRTRLMSRGVSDALADIIDRAANKNAMLRPRSALHLLDALRVACPDKAVWDAGRLELKSLVSRASCDESPIGSAPPDSTSYYQTIAQRALEKRKSEPEPAEPLPDGPPVREGMKCAACGYELHGLSSTGKCPECGASVEQSIRAMPLPCITCGYDLIGLDTAGRCPECGTTIHQSVWPDRLLFADAAWLRRTATGMALLQWGLIGLPLLMIVISLVLLAWGTSTRRAIGGGVGIGVAFGFITVTVIVVIGMIAATTPEPGRPPSILRRWVRATWLMGFGLLIASSVIESIEPKFPDGFLSVPGAHLVLIGIVLFGAWVERLGERIPNRKLIKSGRSVFLPWVLVLIGWLAMILSQSGWLGVRFPSNGLRLLSNAAFLGILYTAALAGAAKKQLRATAKIATVPERAAAAITPPSRPRPAWRGAALALLVFAITAVPLFQIAPRFQLWGYTLAQRLDLLERPANAANFTITVNGRTFPGHPPVAFQALSVSATIIAMYGLPILLGLLVYLRFAMRQPLGGPTRCGWCGYTLTGVPEPRCPECGVAFGEDPEPGSTGPAWTRAKWRRAILMRTAAAAAIFPVAFGLVFLAVITPLHIPEPGPDLRGSLIILATHLPPFAITLIAFHFMTRSIAVLRGQTRCGKCGQELRLNAGRCAACNSTI